MKAIVCRRPGELIVEQRPEPKRGDGEVLLQIRRVGICGTDYHIYKGAHPYLEYPRVMGHELSAEVLEAPKSSALKPGQVVVVNPYISCGTCIACRNGKPNCCVRIAVLGVHRDGGMCERLSLPEANLYAAGDLSIDQAASIEFLAIGAHGVARSGLRTGSRTLVIGAGPIGLGVVVFAKFAGGDVSIMDISAERLSFAAAVTGTREILGGADAATAVREATDGEGFDVVIDATGSKASMESALNYVAAGGSLVFVSVVSDTIAIPDPLFHKVETTLLASRNALRSDFDRVTAAVLAGRVPLDRLLTHRTTLEGAVNDLPRWTTQKQGLVKALIEVC